MTVHRGGRVIVGLLVVLLATATMAVIGVVPPAGATLGAPISGLFLEGEPGAYVTNGQSLSFASVTPQNKSNTFLSFSDGGGSWFVSFAAAPGQTLVPGVYENAQRAGFNTPGHPGLDLSGGGRGCNTVTGRFIIDEVTYTVADLMETFSARFEFHCEGADAAVWGAISNVGTADYRTRTLSASSLDLGAAPIATTGASQSITITNNGPSSLTVASATIGGTGASQFQLDATACTAAPLASSGSCGLQVTFVPTGTPGPRSATLTFFDDISPTSGSGRDIALTGTALSSASPMGEFTPLTPARLVDTRIGTGGKLGKLGPGASFDVQVGGHGDVPASGVSAAVLNVTATEPTVASYLTVWPAGLTRPSPSNLNFVPGQTVPNLVTVALSNGVASIYNNAGATHVIVDVVGFYSDGSGLSGSRFHSLQPVRIFDTRYGTSGVGFKPLAPDQTLKFKVSAYAGVPADATAVVMNVTITEPTSSGFLTVYPDDVSRPVASNLNFVPGLTAPNLVVVRVPASGIVDFYNFSNAGGTVHVLADVVGYFNGDKSTEAGRLIAGQPVRLVDTRVSSPAPPPGCIPGGAIFSIQFLNQQIDAVILNVTVTQPTASGYVTAYALNPANPTPPLASTVNYVPGQTVPNLAMLKLGPDGQIGFYNYAGCTHLVIDAFGAFTNANAPAPAAAGAEAADPSEPYGDVTVGVG